MPRPSTNAGPGAPSASAAEEDGTTMTTVLTIAGLWIFISVALGLLIGRGIKALRRAEGASYSSPPVTATGKPGSDRRRGTARPVWHQASANTRRRERFDEDSI